MAAAGRRGAAAANCDSDHASVSRALCKNVVAVAAAAALCAPPPALLFAFRILSPPFRFAAMADAEERRACMKASLLST